MIDNAQAMASVFIERGYDVVSGGTDNHLFLVSLIRQGLTGKDADAALGRARITVNKNAVPERSAVAVRDLRPAHRHAGGHHAVASRKPSASRWPAGSATSSTTSAMPTSKPMVAGAGGGPVRGLPGLSLSAVLE